MTIGLYTKRTKKCKACKSFFVAESMRQYCSFSCYNSTRSEMKDLKCALCGVKFRGQKYKGYSSKYCSSECYRTDMSNNRKGKKNPAYRNGFAVEGKRTYTGKHLRACSKYRKAFLGKHEYLFCEECGKNSNATPRFEVHHIYYASLYPKHENLHDFRNLILLCIQCHNDFHSGKKKSDFQRLELERGLKQLFI